MKHDILITDGNLELVKKSLAEGKIVLAAVEIGERPEGFKGENIKSTLDAGFAPFLGAKVELKGEVEAGSDFKCFCGEPATHYVYYSK